MHTQIKGVPCRLKCHGLLVVENLGNFQFIDSR